MSMQPQDPIIPLLLGIPLMVLMWAVCLLVPEVSARSALALPALILLTAGYLVALIKWIIDPQRFVADAKSNAERMEKTIASKVMATSLNSWNVDLQVLKVVCANPTIVMPFVAVLVVMFLIVYLPLAFGVTATFLGVWFRAGLPQLFAFSFLVLFYSFVGSSIFSFGYIVLGHLVRVRYMNIPEGRGVIFARYLKLWRSILLLSVTWFATIFTFGGRRGDRRNVAAPRVGLLSILKVFIYMNLTRVSLGDEPSSFKSTYEFVKERPYQMLRVWFGSGLLLSILFFMGICTLVLLGKIGVLLPTDTTKAIVAPLLLLSLFTVLAFRCLAEQIGLFSVYLEEKHGIDLFSFKRT